MRAAPGPSGAAGPLEEERTIPGTRLGSGHGFRTVSLPSATLRISIHFSHSIDVLIDVVQDPSGGEREFDHYEVDERGSGSLRVYGSEYRRYQRDALRSSHC